MARRLMDRSIERRVRQILQPFFDDWADNRIDTETLELHKASAPLQASDELKRDALDSAFSTYSAAVQAREAAWEAYAKAALDEEAAEEAVEAVLDMLEPDPPSKPVPKPVSQPVHSQPVTPVAVKLNVNGRRGSS